MARMRPKDVMTQLALAQCVFNLKDYATARTLVDGALKAAPDNPDVLLLHANLLAKEGKREEGAAVFERARTLDAARQKAEADAAAKRKEERAKQKGGDAASGATGTADVAASSPGKAPTPPTKAPGTPK
jgi:hypothetical protein